MKPRHVVLVGLSGSGKTTVGRALARRLARRFVDTDDLIVERAGKPIPAVFAELGEPAFRALERDAVASAAGGEPAVIATGGGAPVDPRNRRTLWGGNLVVWLDAPIDVLVRRVGHAGPGRPLLAGDASGRLAQLRAVREPVYAEAHVRLDTAGRGVDEIVAAILQHIELDE